MFINNNSGFSCLCIGKASSPNIFRRMWIAQEKIKTKNYIDEELKSESDTDNDNDNNNDTDNEE